MSWWIILTRLLTAVAVGSAIGLEREHKNRPAGMRTHILVCFGAALVAVIDCLNLQQTLAANATDAYTGITMNMGRMSAQVISGIGFLGAGTIFMSQKKVAGLTTAASLWATGCLGLAAGMGYYMPALVGCAIVLITLTVMQRVARPNQIIRLEISYVRRNVTMPFIKDYFEAQGIHVLNVDFHVSSKSKEKIYNNIYTLTLPNRANAKDVVAALSEHENIHDIRTRSI